MLEKEFNIELIDFCQSVVDEYFQTKEIDTSICVGSFHIRTGSIPWWTESRKWKWQEYKRQIDLVIGIEATVDKKKMVIPLIAIELKSGKYLNTDELDKKSAIYGSLKETYPWVHTIFLHADLEERNMGLAYVMRNSRQFDTVFTEWNESTQTLMKKLIKFKLEYFLEYWEL